MNKCIRLLVTALADCLQSAALQSSLAQLAEGTLHEPREHLEVSLEAEGENWQPIFTWHYHDRPRIQHKGLDTGQYQHHVVRHM